MSFGKKNLYKIILQNKVLTSKKFFQRYPFWVFEIYSYIFEEKIVAALNQLVVQALEKIIKKIDSKEDSHLARQTWHDYSTLSRVFVDLDSACLTFRGRAWSFCSAIFQILVGGACILLQLSSCVLNRRLLLPSPSTRCLRNFFLILK